VFILKPVVITISVMSEADFIARLRAIATDPAARGLADDAAVADP
jgi:hypothetical protein